SRSSNWLVFGNFALQSSSANAAVLKEKKQRNATPLIWTLPTLKLRELSLTRSSTREWATHRVLSQESKPKRITTCFKPISGYAPDDPNIKLMSHTDAIEVWLVSLRGTDMYVPSPCLLPSASRFVSA